MASINRFAGRQPGNANHQSRARTVASWRTPISTAPGADLPPPTPKDRYYPETQRVEYGGIPRHPGRRRHATYGSGTREDPRIEWLCSLKTDIHELQQAGISTQGQTTAARHVARLGGFTHVMIRAAAHGAMTAYGADGKKSTFATNGGSWLQKSDTSDIHMTVEMGAGPDKMQIHGHIFLNDRTHPTAPFCFMTEPVSSKCPEGRRHYPGASGDRTSSYEFWVHAGVRVLDLPNQ